MFASPNGWLFIAYAVHETNLQTLQNYPPRDSISSLSKLSKCNSASSVHDSPSSSKTQANKQTITKKVEALDLQYTIRTSPRYVACWTTTKKINSPYFINFTAAVEPEVSARAQHLGYLVALPIFLPKEKILNRSLSITSLDPHFHRCPLHKFQLNVVELLSYPVFFQTNLIKPYYTSTGKKEGMLGRITNTITRFLT